MDVRLTFASDIVDRFEELLARHNISIPRHPQTGADMLPFWYLLKLIRSGFTGTPDQLRGEFTAAVAVHDLAAKVLEVSGHSQFADLLPHLKMLADGAIHLTEPQPAYADAYNKLIEVYWATLCLSAGLAVTLDDPENADGKNPDVITMDLSGKPQHAYAFKTIRSPHTQSILGHVTKGIDQIEKSASVDGIVALHLTPRLQTAGVWPPDGYFASWTHPAVYVAGLMRAMVSQIVLDNGQAAIDALFAGKKAVGSVLCISFCPTVASHPVTSRPTVMPLKVAVIIHLVAGKEPSQVFCAEIERLNHEMQTVLG